MSRPYAASASSSWSSLALGRPTLWSASMTLDPLTVSGEPGYWARLAAQTNIPQQIRDAIATLD